MNNRNHEAARWTVGRTLGLAAVAAAAALSGASGAGAATAPYRNAVLADGATAYYQFEEVTADLTAVDAAGGDNNATYVGGVGRAANTVANLGQAATFDGTDDRVRIPDAATFDLGTGPVTLEYWFLKPTNTRGDVFTYKGTGGDFGVHANSQTPPAGATGSVSVFFNGFISTPGAAANINQWHHVAVTRAANGAMSIYVDGQVGATGTKTDTLNIANDILIGSNHNGDPANPAILFAGQIDEVAWYPVALTQAQIQNHIALAVPEPASAGLLAAAGGLLLGRRRRNRRRAQAARSA